MLITTFFLLIATFTVKASSSSPTLQPNTSTTAPLSPAGVLDRRLPPIPEEPDVITMGCVFENWGTPGVTDAGWIPSFIGAVLSACDPDFQPYQYVKNEYIRHFRYNVNEVEAVDVSLFVLRTTPISVVSTVFHRALTTATSRQMSGDDFVPDRLAWQRGTKYELAVYAPRLFGYEQPVVELRISRVDPTLAEQTTRRRRKGRKLLNAFLGCLNLPRTGSGTNNAAQSSDALETITIFPPELQIRAD